MTKSKKKHLKLRALYGERGIGCKLSNVGAIAKDRDANGSRSRRRGSSVECFREDFFERTCFLSKSIVRVLYYGFFFFSQGSEKMEFAVSACGGNGGKLKILESVLILFLCFFSGKGGGTRFENRWILHVGLLHGSETRVNWSTLETRIRGTTVRVIFYPLFFPFLFLIIFSLVTPQRKLSRIV